jgi:hypothetical protein
MSEQEAFDFVRTCVSHQSEEQRREMAEKFLEKGINWETVVQEAIRHQVLGLFYYHVDALLGNKLSPTFRDQIQEYWRGVRIHNTFLSEELGNVVHQCKKQGIPILTLKGPVLAKVAYGDISLRQYVDLDILIPGSRFSEVDRLLQEMGYGYAGEYQHIRGWRKQLALYLSGQWPFTRRRGPFTIDVHTRIMPPGYAFSSDFQEYWKRSDSVRLKKGVRVQVFGPEDTVLILAHHGTKNQWRALKHVVDLAEYIHSGPDIDWDVLVDRARAMNGSRALKLALIMVRDVMSASLPVDVHEWAKNEEDVCEVAVRMKGYLRKRYQNSDLSYRKRVLLQLATKDTRYAQLRYIAHSIMHHVWSSLLSP